MGGYRLMYVPEFPKPVCCPMTTLSCMFLCACQRWGGAQAWWSGRGRWPPCLLPGAWSWCAHPPCCWASTTVAAPSMCWHPRYGPMRTDGRAGGTCAWREWNPLELACAQSTALRGSVMHSRSWGLGEAGHVPLLPAATPCECQGEPSFTFTAPHDLPKKELNSAGGGYHHLGRSSLGKSGGRVARACLQ
jgi:hypothetical protein